MLPREPNQSPSWLTACLTVLSTEEEEEEIGSGELAGEKSLASKAISSVFPLHNNSASSDCSGLGDSISSLKDAIDVNRETEFVPLRTGLPAMRLY